MAMGCPHQGRSGGLNATITSRPLTYRGPHRVDTYLRAIVAEDRGAACSTSRVPSRSEAKGAGP